MFVLAAIVLASFCMLVAGCGRSGGDPYDPSIEILPEAVDFGDALLRKVRSYFTGAAFCTVESANDPDEGRVIRIKSKNVKKDYTSVPEVFFNYKEFCKSVGVEPVHLNEKPFVVMKVKAQNAHDRLFSIFAHSAADILSLHSLECSAVIPDESQWHYIVFDLSEETHNDLFTVFRLRFEQLAVKSGESVLISEMRFCTGEDAKAYKENPVYEIDERTADNYTLRLLSYNIQTEAGNSAPFPVRASMLKNFIDEKMPDLAGFQEVTPTWRKWLAEYVFNESYGSAGRERELGGEANTLYYRKDKFDLIDSGTFWLSPTPEVEGSGFEGYSYVRICTWVHLKDKVTGTEFVHMNLHLDINGEKTKAEGNQMRADQIGVIVRFAQRFKGLPLFVSGDFNTLRTKSDGESVHDAIRLVEGTLSVKDDDGNDCSLKLSDTRLNALETVDSSHTATMTKYYDKNNKNYEPTREPIDYVFYDANFFEPLRYSTYILADNGLEVSDHLAVFTTFRLIKSN